MTKISLTVLETINNFENKTLALSNSAPIVEFAMRVAYYQAMIDAALADPLDDADEHQAVLELLTARRDEYTETFQALVNDEL
jgi:hypothetical protein